MKAFFATMLLTVCSLPAPLAAAWMYLPESQVRQLHEAVCAGPVHPGEGDRAEALVCDAPRDYPDPARDGATAETCPLSFDAASRDGSVAIFYGSFTEDETQALAFYQAECEPHANGFGGAALFKIEEGNFVLIRYYPGLVADDCVVPAPVADERHVLYCYTSDLAQGELTESFGPLRFRSDGTAVLAPWLTAGNIDAALAIMTECGKPEVDIRFFTGIRLDAAVNQIVVDGAVLDLEGVKSACDRYGRGDFSKPEQALRDISEVATSRAFVRPEEERYRKVEVRFTPPDPMPHIDITTVPIEVRR